jgi:hypothetical protein
MNMPRFVLDVAILGTAVPAAPAGPIRNFIQRRHMAQQQKQMPYNQQPTNRMPNQQPYYPPQNTQPPQTMTAPPPPVTTVAPPAPAPQPPQLTPAQRVSQLLVLVKSGPAENQRAAAATELRTYDGQQYPQIVPTLIDVLQTDTSAAVRAEVAVSLGKIRPISPQAGYALQQASNGDDSMRVRWQAKAALAQYQMSGYKPAPPTQTADGSPTTAEPPLAEPLPAAPPAPKVVSQPVSRPAAVKPAPTAPSPAPKGPPPSPLVPAEAPKLFTPPPSYDEGPILSPQH